MNQGPLSMPDWSAPCQVDSEKNKKVLSGMGLLQNQVIFAAASFFFKEGNPGSAEHYIFRLKRSRLMQKV